MKKRVCISIGPDLHASAKRFAAGMEMDFSELLSALLRRAIECGGDRQSLVRWLYGAGAQPGRESSTCASALPSSAAQAWASSLNTPDDDLDDEDDMSDEALTALSQGDDADRILCSALRQRKDAMAEFEAESQVVGRIAERVKPPRNAMCPCGSGLKFKRCCEATWPKLKAPS